MGFLIKSAFWLSLVLLLIPFGGTTATDGEQTVGPVEAFFAAKAAIGDMAGICERQPHVCEIGRSAFTTIGIRAKEGARLAYGVLDEQFGETAATQEPIHTGSVELPQDVVLPVADFQPQAQ